MAPVAEAWDQGPYRRLDELLEVAEISNVAAAAKLGIHNSTVQRYRKGTVVPPADHLAALIEMANGSADWVLGLKPEGLNERAAAVFAAAERLVEDIRRHAHRFAPMSPRRAYGTGSVYQRGRIYWIQWLDHLGRHRESTKSDSPKVAEKLLRQRLTEADAGNPSPDTQKALTLRVMLEMVAADYRANGRTSVVLLPSIIGHLCRLLGENTPAAKVDEAVITWYQAQRLAEITPRRKPTKPATINRELAILRRAFRLALRSRRIHRKPDVSMLREDNIRKGFVEPEQLEAILVHLPEVLHPLARTAYVTGWRMKSELQSRQRRHLDLEHGWLRLEPGEDKNKLGRMFKLTAELRAVLGALEERTKADERRLGVVIPWLFHRDGRRFKDIDRAWNTACRKAGLPGRLRHDFRRSAVRNLERAGVPRSAAMAAVGHLTEAMYRRYAIVDERMLEDVAKRLDEQYSHKRAAAKRRK